MLPQVHIFFASASLDLLLIQFTSRLFRRWWLHPGQTQLGKVDALEVG
jgi:hypothetical protein